MSVYTEQMHAEKLKKIPRAPPLITTDNSSILRL